MKHSVLFRFSLLSLLFSILVINVQGLKVHTKNGIASYYSQTDVDGIVFVAADTDIDVPITPTSGTAIDLGLSVKWASCNVGATVPEEYGSYYAWGDLEEKNDYGKSTYLYWNNQTDDYTNIGDNISGTQYDMARAKWGGSWRLPTLEEFYELDNKCKWEWATYNGVRGRLVTGPNGNSVFLPAAGYCREEEVYDRGSVGNYWSGSLNTAESDCAYCLYFHNGSRNPGYYFNYRDYGVSVRPVSD